MRETWGRHQHCLYHHRSTASRPATQTPSLKRTREITAYYNTTYLRDVNTLALNAAAKIQGLVDSGCLDGRRPLVIMDLDDTLWSTYDPYLSIYNSHTRGPHLPKGYCAPLGAMVTLYHFLREHNIEVAFLTGRYAEAEPFTRKNLDAIGVSDYSHLIHRAPNEESLTALQYKSQRRAQLARDYHIIANFGDQMSDLLGGNSGYFAYKLPNPRTHIS